MQWILRDYTHWIISAGCPVDFHKCAEYYVDNGCCLLHSGYPCSYLLSDGDPKEFHGCLGEPYVGRKVFSGSLYL